MPKVDPSLQLIWPFLVVLVITEVVRAQHKVAPHPTLGRLELTRFALEQPPLFAAGRWLEDAVTEAAFGEA